MRTSQSFSQQLCWKVAACHSVICPYQDVVVQAKLETPSYLARLGAVWLGFFVVVAGPIAFQTFDPSKQVQCMQHCCLRPHRCLVIPAHLLACRQPKVHLQNRELRSIQTCIMLMKKSLVWFLAACRMDDEWHSWSSCCCCCCCGQNISWLGVCWQQIA